ncbi:glycosyl hydrolase family 18 protein [Chryseolinea sp. T2]|uniref:glycosyl hydrolase family 18 protein n=1 Tax=Chryseolinea sp. T2 TaxID=3129255 RepID=UPI0030779C01
MMISEKRLASLFVAALMSLSVYAQQQSFKVVGYYNLKSATEGYRAKQLKYLTNINLWFVNPDSSGRYTQDFKGLQQFVEKAHKHHTKVLFSIGGGSKQPQYKWLLADDRRAQLIDSLMVLVMRYNLDGIDVDLEGSDIHDTYENFVVDLATALHARQKLITSAVAIYYKDQFTDKALAQYDFMNVMSYDRTCPWRPENPGPHSLYTHAVDDLNYFGVERKIPTARLTLGVPFYGYGYGPELSSPAISMGYKKIVATYKGADQVDEWKTPEGKTLYYNGLPTMRLKTKLAMAKASGIMIWEVRSDAKGRKSLLRAIHKESR